MTLNRSMSSSATASADLVRTARLTSAAASCSQVAAFSSPVLESARASMRSWACRSERWSSVITGSAAGARNRFPATAYVSKMPMHISAMSL